MQNVCTAFVDLSDRDLLATVRRLAADERHATVQLVASLGELDARRLYLGEGYSSLFSYCTQVLHLSEHAASNRIAAARVARRFPVILNLLTDGAITLTTVTLLAPHLTPDNHGTVLEAARHKSKREVERQVASLHPRPDEPPSIRKQPPPKSRISMATVLPPGSIPCEAPEPIAHAPLIDSATATSPDVPRQVPLTPSMRPAHTATGAPILAESEGSSGDSVETRALQRRSARSAIEPLAPERYKVQFTVGEETVAKLRRVRDLMRHAVPDGDPAVIFDRALTLLLGHLERTKCAATNRPRASHAPSRRSRHIPAAVRRAVWTRDEGRCTFVGTAGRCTERGRLEFHHCDPYALGGEATVENIALRCRAHNAYEAEQEFGGEPFTLRSGIESPRDPCRLLP